VNSEVVTVLRKMHFETVPLAEVPLARANSVDEQSVVVMVVDDEKVIADTLVAILARSGYTAIAAYDGESALERAVFLRR
jgi:PleD family two-component response regulator